MRLSADVINRSEQRNNPLGEREIVLRGLAIPSIEHLSVTRDQFDAIDLADNRITRIDNFPRLLRLTSLSLSGNNIESFDVRNLVTNVPNLRNLVLTNNKVTGLHEVANIGSAWKQLEFLTLVGNPVVRREHYRLYTILKIPTLRVLDFVKVKETERNCARRLEISAAGAELEGDVRLESQEWEKDVVMSEKKQRNLNLSIKEVFENFFSNKQQEYIKNLISNASSLEEIEKIEQQVKEGKFSFDNDRSSQLGRGNISLTN